ncbi:ABC transporter ATP-binding protein [Candidatus Bipolaricaulota bacterium]|nr:ABC transporter ATP-binding protein [Candidatus Bipolaricaulota bacterium]
MKNNKVMEVKNLKKYFPQNEGLFSWDQRFIKAVDEVSCYVNQGEILGVVGESGCGKTTLGRTVLLLTPPTSGTIYFQGEKLDPNNKKQLKNLRIKTSLIFQDPYLALHPIMTTRNLVAEPVRYHSIIADREERERRVEELVINVGLTPGHLEKYSHELSGGEKQRVAIARALSTDPIFVVADEPVAALDASIQAGILNLIKEMKEELGFSCLLISHDLSIVRYLCTRVLVMYAGKIVELAEKELLFESPTHPYTKALLSSIPTPTPKQSGERLILQGSPPSLLNPPSGCRLNPRCPLSEDLCKTEEPELTETDTDHLVACHFPDRPWPE